MAPQTHTRYRVQRLIRLGEWLERNQDAMVMAFDAIDEAHDLLIDPDDDMPTSDIVEISGFKMLQPVMAMQKMMMELRHDLPTRHVKMGEDVTIHQPFAALRREWEVVIEAPKPDVPSQKQYDLAEQERLKAEYDAAQAEPTPEEFDKVRSEVDGI